MTDALDGKRDFFVSFNKADRAWATWIAWVLEEAGYAVWFQDWDFTGNFILEMDRAHQQSRRTLAVLSPDYLASRFTAPEWAARFAEDATSEHDRLIPVRVRPCALKGLLAPIVHLDLVGCTEPEARKKILDRVAGIRLKPDEPPLFPGPPEHQAITDKPVFPVKAPPPPGRPPAGGAGWLARHKEIVFGGTGAAIIGAVLTWGLGATLEPSHVNIIGFMAKILEVAASIADAYSLAALAIIVLFLLFRGVLSKVGVQKATHSFAIIMRLMSIVATVAVLLLLLTFSIKAYEIIGVI